MKSIFIILLLAFSVSLVSCTDEIVTPQKEKEKTGGNTGGNTGGVSEKGKI